MQRTAALRAVLTYPVLLFLLLVGPIEVQAHTRLISSEPVADAVLQAAPNHIVLHFSAPPDKGFSELQWSKVETDTWRSLKVQQQGKQLKAVLPELAPGRYKIRWSVLSRDGHRQRGVFQFKID